MVPGRKGDGERGMVRVVSLVMLNLWWQQLTRVWSVKLNPEIPYYGKPFAHKMMKMRKTAAKLQKSRCLLFLPLSDLPASCRGHQREPLWSLRQGWGNVSPQAAEGLLNTWSGCGAGRDRSGCFPSAALSPPAHMLYL